MEGPFSTPFARQGEPAPEPAQPAPPQPVYRRPVALRLGAAALLLVVCAAFSGALVGHALWSSSPQTVTVAGPTVTTPRTVNPGGNFGGGSGGTGRFGGNAGTPGNTGGTGSFGSSSTASSGTSSGPANADSIAASVSPAHVDVNAQYSYQGSAGAGTGIVISSNGRVVTNNHVVDGATKITATDIGNGKTYTATVVGYDPSHDIAVLQLQGASGLKAVATGDSSKLSVGDKIVGIGNAGGTGGTPSSAGGAITALDQSITAEDDSGGAEQLSGLIQTNANIQPGDSGGPLVDSSGKVIGMDTAGSTGFRFQMQSTAAFAIPIDQVLQTASQIASGKGTSTTHVGETAFLGVTVSAASNGDFGDPFGGAYGRGGGSTTASGVIVGSVLNGEPAQKAGLQPGDVITALDGHGVDSTTGLGSIMLGHHPGDKVQLTWTDTAGASHTATVTLASGPAS